MISLFLILVLFVCVYMLKKDIKPLYITKYVKVAVPMNVNTQRVENYKLIGYLHNNDSKMLPLYGRRVHVNNTRWNYYTKSDNYSYSIHVFLNHKNRDCGSEYGCDELYDNDQVYIKEFNGNFYVKLYDNHYRYNPQII